MTKSNFLSSTKMRQTMSFLFVAVIALLSTERADAQTNSQSSVSTIAAGIPVTTALQAKFDTNKDGILEAAEQAKLKAFVKQMKAAQALKKKKAVAKAVNKSSGTSGVDNDFSMNVPSPVEDAPVGLPGGFGGDN